MKNQKIILNRLLNKYESSKHLLNPGTSLRRVMLEVTCHGGVADGLIAPTPDFYSIRRQYRRQPYHRSGQRCPHQGSAAKVSLFRFDDGRLL